MEALCVGPKPKFQKGTATLCVLSEDSGSVVGSGHGPCQSSTRANFGFRAKIQQFGLESKRLTVETRFERLYDLSILASATYQELPRQDYATSTNTAATDTHHFRTLDALYYMCQMALHSTVVPLFSGSSPDPGAKPEEVRNSAREVLTYAQRFAALLNSYLPRLDVSHISPLVGYGAFITGGVIIAHEVAMRKSCPSGDSLWSSAISERHGLSAVRAILDLLGALSLYWRVLQSPVSLSTCLMSVLAQPFMLILISTLRLDGKASCSSGGHPN